MRVDGFCLSCDRWFDAHWHHFPTSNYKCPNCGNAAKLRIEAEPQNVDLGYVYEDVQVD